MRDNIEDIFVIRGKKGDFVTKTSLNFKTNVQRVEIVSINAQISYLCLLNLIVDIKIQDSG